jgi:hypothetical protein
VLGGELGSQLGGGLGGEVEISPGSGMDPSASPTSTDYSTPNLSQNPSRDSLLSLVQNPTQLTSNSTLDSTPTLSYNSTPTNSTPTLSFNSTLGDGWEKEEGQGLGLEEEREGGDLNLSGLSSVPLASLLLPSLSPSSSVATPLSLAPTLSLALPQPPALPLSLALPLSPLPLSPNPSAMQVPIIIPASVVIPSGTARFTGFSMQVRVTFRVRVGYY